MSNCYFQKDFSPRNIGQQLKIIKSIMTIMTTDPIHFAQNTFISDIMSAQMKIAASIHHFKKISLVEALYSSIICHQMPITIQVFNHFTPTYDTFLESLGRWEYSGRVYRTFGHHQEDQEGQECSKHGILEDFGCLDVYFVIVPPHMIPSWNPKAKKKQQVLCRRQNKAPFSGPRFQ